VGVIATGALDWQAARESRSREPQNADGQVDKEVLPKERRTLAQGFFTSGASAVRWVEEVGEAAP